MTREETHLEFGVTLPTYLAESSAEFVKEIANIAEELGYSSVWVTDHILVPFGAKPYESILEAIATLSWVAGCTHSIRLGLSTLILANENQSSLRSNLQLLITCLRED